MTAEPGESPNDRNDRAIRVAAAWYDARLAPSMPILFLTNDADNRRKAQEAGLRALTVAVSPRLRFLYCFYFSFFHSHLYISEIQGWNGYRMQCLWLKLAG